MSLSLLTLALVGTVMLLLANLQGHAVTSGAMVRPHFLLALAATFVLVMAHAFIMFFLIATGVELKEMEQARGWGDSFRRRTVAIKGRVFPLMTTALLLVIANFVLGAAAHTRAIPAAVHGLVGWATFAVCAAALYREYRALGENNRLIAEAASRREDRATAEEASPDRL